MDIEPPTLHSLIAESKVLVQATRELIKASVVCRSDSAEIIQRTKALMQESQRLLLAEEAAPMDA